MNDGYKTVNEEFQNVTVIEKSKFICYLKGIENEEQAKDFILSIKKLNSLANHNCYAYIADEKGLVMKFSDDGEPQGTAGLPMLEVLKNKGLYKTVAVVTRYFGGIKLGTGGLTRAYGGAVSQCVELSKVLNMERGSYFEIVSDYENYSALLRAISVPEISVLNTDFGDKITVSIAIKQEFIDKFLPKLSDIYKGKQEYSQKQTEYFSFENVCQK
ncbi:MAG: YigZ family protein [Clostridia bacterium]|nr:YigZ family protein [Clostridia bacterium]